MTLLDRYLQAVRMFLPGDVPHADILAELGEQLQSMTDEREARLGRPLTEVEQEQLLNDYGTPMIVAGRYGGGTRQLSFGGVLIGPELFPLYLRILLVNWAIAIGIHALLAFVLFEKPVGPRPFVTTVVCQFVGLTLTFAVIDRLQRHTRQRWYFPPAYLQPVPRWHSVSGLIVFAALLTLWAIAVPSLVPGEVAPELTLAPGGYAVYWSVLILMVAAVAQRAINLVRPDWNWLLPAARLTTNGAGLVMLYFLQAAHPYVAVAAPVASEALTTRASQLNGFIWWMLVGVAPFYFLTFIAIWGWYFAQYVCYVLRRRQAGAAHGARA
jgi:hypothetical protein